MHINALHECGDLLVGDVASGDAPPPTRAPPMGAVNSVVILEHSDPVDNLLVRCVYVGVVVEPRAHPEAALLHRLVDEIPHLGPFLLRAVALVVEAHHLGPDSAVAHEGGVVHRDADRLNLLEVSRHVLPVQGPAKDLLHPLIGLLQRVVGLLRIELERIEVGEAIH